MKKIVLIFSILFISITGSFAYNNGIGVFASTPSGVFEDKAYVNINANCEILFSCNFTSGELGYEHSSNGYAYLKHGGSLVDSFSYNRPPNSSSNGSYSSTGSGYWYQLELLVYCQYNAIGLAQLNW